MTTRPLLPGELSVLAMLIEGPMHGYELARCFERDDLAEVCPVEQSMLYTYLRNIEERGLVEWHEVRSGRRPPRKVYALTADGRAAVDTWLNEPVGRMRQVRLEFLLKLYFLHHLEPRAELTLLQRQVAVCEDYRQRLGERAACTTGFPRLVANSKLSAADATLHWLREYITEIEAHPNGGE